MAMTDVLRQALIDSGESYYKIEKETGIDHRILGRFVNDEGSPTGKKLDVLCDYFDLELVSKKQGKKKGQTSGKK